MLSVQKNESSAGKMYVNLKVSTCVQRSFVEKGDFQTMYKVNCVWQIEDQMCGPRENLAY